MTYKIFAGIIFELRTDARASGRKLVDLLATTAIHRIFILSTYSSNCTKVSEKKFFRSKIFYLSSENSPVGPLKSHETRVRIKDRQSSNLKNKAFAKVWNIGK